MFLLYALNKGTQQETGQKGTTREPAPRLGQSYSRSQNIVVLIPLR